MQSRLLSSVTGCGKWDKKLEAVKRFIKKMSFTLMKISLILFFILLAKRFLTNFSFALKLFP